MTYNLLQLFTLIKWSTINGMKRGSRFTLCRDLHPLKELDPIVSSEFGKLMASNPQFWKALDCIFSNLSEKVTSARAWQS